MIEITPQIETRACEGCGILYVMPLFYRQELVNNHKTFYCPAGRPGLFLEHNKEEILSEAYAREAAIANELRRIKHRVKNGVCPYTLKFK